MSPVTMRSAALAGRRLVSARAVVPASSLLRVPFAARGYASQPDPQSKAQSIIDALPGNSALSKSGILATGVAGSVYAIANSLYVVNAESCLLGVFGVFLVVAAKTVAPAYKEWAEGHVANITKALNSARAEQLKAVQERVDQVEKVGGVSDVTSQLFEVSRQTVELENKAFELSQRVTLAAEAKSVLDSWVRYESQIRSREQAELAKAVEDKIAKTVDSEKFQADALKQALADVEAVFKKAN